MPRDADKKSATVRVKNWFFCLFRTVKRLIFNNNCCVHYQQRVHTLKF